MSPSHRVLAVKKEVLAELSPEDLANVNAGLMQAITTQAQACVALSLNPDAICISPTCGPGCTARSVITDVE